MILARSEDPAIVIYQLKLLKCYANRKTLKRALTCRTIQFSKNQQSLANQVPYLGEKKPERRFRNVNSASQLCLTQILLDDTTKTVNNFSATAFFQLRRPKERGQISRLQNPCNIFFQKNAHAISFNHYNLHRLDKTHARAQFPPMLDSKLTMLRDSLRNCGSTLIAYSGGVDSVFLAFVANEVLPNRCVAAIADSPSLPRRELNEALDIAAKFNLPVRVIKTAEFGNSDYTSNPLNRCYFCKHELFTELIPLAKQLNLAVIAYGENASDIGDFRPGSQAAIEFHIRAPLKEAGLTKTEIRALSARFGLPTTDKPQMACLSSRVPHGEPVTEEKLRMIEAAENLLRDLGFFDIRVRHHELLRAAAPTPLKAGLIHNNLAVPPTRSALARIEVGTGELPRLLDSNTAARVADELKRIGYAHVTLDLQGYRRGGANDLAQKPAT